MENLVGTTIRGYELLERIGEGGFGVVYRAHQSAIERDVVIKAILPTYANNPDFIRNFEAEAQLIARLEHFHIVPLYDYWRSPEGAFLVMRWLRGGSLLDSVARAPWKASAVAKLLDQMAGALTIAHRNNIVHQDIKPANILLDEENNAYLTDFGLAKNLETELDLSVASDSNVHGSPAYISPEQIRRDEITPRTDIYSLGIVLYELLCGQHPFDTTDVVELLGRQLNSQIPAIQSKQPGLPDSLNLVLWRATAKDPDIRYASAIEMAEAFHQALADAEDTPVTEAAASATSQSVSREITGVISLESLDALLAGPANPYKGLHAFQEADTADFFGRDSLVKTLLQRLRETGNGHRFLAVVGPSGSGKSSAVKAGLLPAIRTGRIRHWDRWFMVDMTPGAVPLAELENALLTIATDGNSDLAGLLEGNVQGLHRAIQAVLPEDGTELVLVIDQFEEVFTQVADESARAHFLDLICHAVTVEDSRLRLIITLRADFYDRPLAYSGFGDLMRTRTEVVLPLSEDELREVISAPAAQVNLTVENDLAEVIINDVARQPNALPLLQFTLTELYEQRKKDTLTLESYRAIGGITGSLARRADELYTGFNQDYRQIARQIFLRLVVPGEGTEDTRRRVMQPELTSLAEDRQIVQHILETFGQYRLLAFDRDPATRTPTVEVAHEALIRNWANIREWLNESRDNLRIHRQLTNATGDWLGADQDPSFLASGVRLTQFAYMTQSNSIALNETEQAYLQASAVRNRRNVRLRRAAVLTLIAITVIALVAATIAIDQSNRTEIARQQAVAAEATAIAERERADQEAIISRSRELAASALTTQDQVDLPLLLSVEALAIADTLEARNSLLTTLQAQPRLSTFLRGHDDTIRSVAYGERFIASGGRDRTVRLWDTATHKPVGPPLEGHQGWVNAVTFSPDERLLASGSEDGTIIIRDMGESTVPIMTLTGHTDAVWSLSFSPDGRILASGSADNSIWLWDVASGQPIAPTLDPHQGIVYTLAFSPDGRTLASGSADGTIRLWDTTTFQTRHILQGHTNWVFSVNFSPDGQLLASGSADNTLRFWDARTGDALGNPLRGHANWVRAVKFDDSGQHVLSASVDGFIITWDIATGQPIDLLENPGRAAIWSFDLSPAHDRLVAAGMDSALRLWNLDNQPEPGTIIGQQSEEILALAASPDGKYLASAGGRDEDYTIKLGNAADGNLLAALSGHAGQVTAAVFDPTQPRLATGSADRTAIIWDLETMESLGRIDIEDGIFALAYSPDGERLAIGDNSGQITTWRVSGSSDTWQLDSVQFAGHDDRVLSLAFHPDNNLVASGSRDTTIRLWDTTTGAAVGNPATAHTDGILSIAFNPDGSLLASGSRDETARLWSITDTGLQASGEPLVAHSNWVMSVAFSPDGVMLASASGDRTIMLWHVAERRPIGNPLLGHTEWVNALAFMPDGQRLISGGRDGQLIAWPASTTAWHDRACQIANRDFSQTERQQYFRNQSPLTSCEEGR